MAIISISDSQVNGVNQILVADSSSKIPAKDGSQITVLNATNVATGTIASARLDTGTTAGKLVVLDGSGNLPAVNGSLLTGIVSATISASDPTISTNPSGGVGTEWINSTSGENYICTDATAGENIWKNIGAGSGNIEPTPHYQGENYGYVGGGAAGPALNIIDKWSLTSNGNATDVGDLTVTRSYVVGQSSQTYGYYVGGDVTIDKNSFASDGNATDVGDQVVVVSGGAAASSETHGYTGGGYHASAPNLRNTIQKHSFTTDGNTTDIADLTVGRSQCGGCSSATYGYACGGASPYFNEIDKYPFASDTNATDVGNILVANYLSDSGTSSETHGYVCGGWTGGASSGVNVIQKFTLASDNNSTDVGNTFGAYASHAGCSSTTYGYWAGGGPPNLNEIHQYSFTTDGDSTDVGNLTAARRDGGGTQY